MLGLPPSLSSDPVIADVANLVPGATELARDVAACHKRSNILLALTHQDLAEAKEWLDRAVAVDPRNGQRPSLRK